MNAGTDAVVGLQIEDCRAVALRRHPAWDGVLALASPSGQGEAASNATRQATLARFVEEINQLTEGQP